MYDLGKTLKTSRNRKFLTIEEVSSITKIKEHYLTALEEEDLDQLPARVYSIGFINNLADLYDLPSAELILAYDRLKDNSVKLKTKKDFSSINKAVYEKTYDDDYDHPIKKNKLLRDEDSYIKPGAFEETFSKIKELSLDDKESYDGSISMIDEYIETSKDELKALSLLNEIENSNQEIKDLDEKSSNTFPTSKVMLEFEELIREEERFNTQKLRKIETERNINKTKNRVAQNRGFGMNHETRSGASLMILILLSIAIFVLLYIIIQALIAR